MSHTRRDIVSTRQLISSDASTQCHRLVWFLLIALCAGCVSIAGGAGGGKAVSNASADARETALGKQFLTMSDAHAGDSGYYLLHVGVDGLAARVQMIRHAERTLDLQYFIFRGDQTGTLVREELRHAADRGVRIRVLVDDGDTVPGDEQLLELDGYPNMQVRIFNPFDTRSHNVMLRNLDFLFHKSRLDYRMHNKLLVADNVIALVGGRNIGNQYFQVDPESQFADDEVFVAGPMARTLSQEFDEFWNGDMTVPAQDLKGLGVYHAPISIPVVRGGRDYLTRIDSGEPFRGLSSGVAPLIWTSARLVYDSPGKKYIEQRAERGRLMSQSVEQEFARAQHEALIVSPYFVPSDHELSLLEAMQTRDATAKTLTNSLEAAPSLAAHSGYDKVRVKLLRAGVELYEVRALLDSDQGSGQTRQVSRYGNYGLHAKLYVFDRQRCFIGSWNFDRRSLRINTEMGLLIENSRLAQDVARRFEEMTKPAAAYHVMLDPESSKEPKLIWETEMDHRHVRFFKEPSRGWLQRDREKLLALLPLQPEL
jgi:cardiolipin synthase C